MPAFLTRSILVRLPKPNARYAATCRNLPHATSMLTLGLWLMPAVRMGSVFGNGLRDRRPPTQAVAKSAFQPGHGLGSIRAGIILRCLTVLQKPGQPTVVLLFATAGNEKYDGQHTREGQKLCLCDSSLSAQARVWQRTMASHISCRLGAVHDHPRIIPGV